MKFVSETVIDAVVEQLENQEQESMIRELEQAQPAILAYLLSDNFQLFAEEERDYFLFLTLVLYKSIEQLYPEILRVDSGAIAKAEESNWAVLEGVKTKQLRDRWTPFFDQYPQEDLLAFVEDALEPDEESQITNEGREFIFVSLKSVIDSVSTML